MRRLLSAPFARRTSAGRQLRRLFALIDFDVHRTNPRRAFAFRRVRRAFRRIPFPSRFRRADASAAAMNRPASSLLLALYEPDIAQNAGAIMRTCACLGVDAAIIEPAGFRIGDPRFRRVRHGLSRLAVDRAPRFVGPIRGLASLGRPQARAPDHEGRGEAVGLCVSASTIFSWSAGNRLACQMRSHASADARLRIPIEPPLRSLNVGVAATIALVEALRQIGRLPIGQRRTEHSTFVCDEGVTMTRRCAMVARPARADGGG